MGIEVLVGVGVRMEVPVGMGGASGGESGDLVGVEMEGGGACEGWRWGSRQGWHVYMINQTINEL